MPPCSSQSTGRYKLRLYYLTGGRAITAPVPGPAKPRTSPAWPARSRRWSPRASRPGWGRRSTPCWTISAAPLRRRVVLLSDGVNTEGPDLAEGAAYGPPQGRAAVCRRPGRQPAGPQPEAQRPLGRGVRLRPRSGQLRGPAHRHRLRRPGRACRAPPARPAQRAGRGQGQGRTRRPAADRPPSLPAGRGGRVPVRRRDRARRRRRPDGRQPPGAVIRTAHPVRVPQGEDPRALGPGLSQLRVPLPAQHARPRPDDRPEDRAPGRRRGARRAGRRQPARVPGPQGGSLPL